MKFNVLIFILLLININLHAQSNINFIRCSSVEYEQITNNKLKISSEKRILNFEDWLTKAINNNITKKSSNNQTVYTIPVVFHVLHNGDPLGSNENVSDLQLQSQITRLNQDFRRKANTLGYNTNTVGADVEIEFCLAQIDPNGNFTNGIKRHLINKSALYANDVENLKPDYIWDSTKYLNIFIVNFAATASGTTLGYAQFPIGSGLPGLSPGMSYNDTVFTDSVVLNYMVVGSKSIYPQGSYALSFDEGRTATHEVGHWLGLRHIWGDIDSCTEGTDYCDDTPHHKNFNRGCLVNNTPCLVREMTENYMDYTDDRCLNTFTQDQKTRMRTVLENDYRRNFLITSNKCTYVPVLNKDVGILDLQVQSKNCNLVTLNLEFVNLGIQSVGVIQYQIKVNDAVTTYTINENIDSPAVKSVLVSIPVNSGISTIEVKILNVDGATDDNSQNNIKSISVQSDYIVANASEINMQLVTDRFANETTWSFVGPGINLQNGVLENSYTHIQNLPLASSGCYTFTIKDRSGDGICCNFGSGNLKLSINGVNVYNNGGYGSGFSLNFHKETLSESSFNISDFYIIPNPGINEIQIIGPENLPPLLYSIINSIGQILVKDQLYYKENSKIDISYLSTGVYFTHVKFQDKLIILKFIKK